MTFAETQWHLQQALQTIKETLHRLPDETVDLGEALNRIAYTDIAAERPLPAFAESTRDGYVIALAGRQGGAGRFKIVDEIAAGRVHRIARLAAGTAIRIMTGGRLPEGSERVVPYEQCAEQDGEVRIAEHLLQGPQSYIRGVGSEIARGQRLVGHGVKLRAEHLELLASCGILTVAVSARPAVGYFCTGSELKLSTVGLKNGQKVSSNSFLLSGLVSLFGGTPKDLGIVGDTSLELQDVFAWARGLDLDVIISTGGMGPGKYDLVEKAFVDAGGGTILFNSLAVRPGKAVLFGRLGETLFFGLPGPPYAVRTLMHELVGPALLAMQGGGDPGPKRRQAYLLHPVESKLLKVMHLKDGVLELEGGRCSVRLADRLENANCHILLHPGRTRFAEGELVDVHLLGDLGAAL
jgi:molybdopterin molybdotransferase